MNSTLSILLVLCFALQTTYGKRGFEILMDSMNCTGNPKYVANDHCYINRTRKEGRAFVDFKVVSETQLLTYSLDINVIRSKNERMTLISVQDADGCAFLDGKIEWNLVNIYRDVLDESGELPRCPIPKGYHMLFQNMRIDVDKFPPYLPEAKFSFLAGIKAEKEFFFDIQLYGSIVQKRRFG